MSRKKRILISSGGTGGHIFPAHGLAENLLRENSEVLFVGGGLDTNRYFNRKDFRYNQVSCSSLKSPLAPLKIAKGIYQSCKILRNYQPDVVVGFGSYYTFPTLIATKLCKVPLILYVADSIPGKVNRLFAPFSEAIGVNFPNAISKIKGNCIEVGMPLRNEVKKGNIFRPQAAKYFGIDENKFTLLVFGGSQGAQAINNILAKSKIPSTCQVVHFTGSDSAVNNLKRAYELNGIKAYVCAFEKNMASAWSVADIFVGRAGASTISEAMEHEVPGLLIPYPTSAENHQETNADYFVNTVSGGVKILEKDITPEKFVRILVEIANNKDIYKSSIASYRSKVLNTSLCDLVMRY